MKQCVDCGSSLPDSHNFRTCSMCYGDINHGTDGYYLQWAEEQSRREQAELEEKNRELDIREQMEREHKD